MKKKLSVMLLALLLVASLAFGCNNNPVKPEFSGSYQDINAFVTDEITVPSVTFTEGATLTVVVNAPNGSVVEVEENKFVLAEVGTYVISYTIEKSGLTAEMQIKVNSVQNTEKPVIELDGVNEKTVLKDAEVTLATATAKDAIDNSLNVVVTVVDSEGNEVTVTDNKFTATVLGDYTVTYSTEDKYGNTQEVVNTINCYKLPDVVAPVPENVANSFETEEESYVEKLTNETAGYTAERNSSDDNYDAVRSGAYSLKLTSVSGGTFNLLSEVITGNNDLSEIGKISIWVYNPLETSAGFSIFKIILKNGNSVTPNLYTSIAAGSWAEYSVNLMECGLTEEQLESVYAIQLWAATSVTEVYLDDISYDLRSDYPVIGSVEETIIVKQNVEFPIPVPTVSEGAELSYKLTDSEGTEITVTEGKWTPDTVGTYTITYTATKSGNTATAITVLKVADKPLITLSATNVSSVTAGDEVTIATATAKDFLNNDIEVSVTVTDSEGNEVTLVENKFTANVIGDYIVKYTTQDEHGNSNEIENVITCKSEPVSKGDVPAGVINSFETEAECYLTQLDAGSSGYDVFWNSTNDYADGVRSGAYSLKVVSTGTGQFNLLSEVITGNNDLSDIGIISLWVYNPQDTAQGMSIYKTVLKNGTAISTEVYKSVPAKSWWEFSYSYYANESITEEQLGSVYSIQLWGVKEIYIDDITVVERSAIKPAEPANTALSIEKLGASYTNLNVAVNTDTQYVKDGTMSLKMTLSNTSDGRWSLADHTKWSSGIVMTEDVNVLTFQVYATADVRVAFYIGTGGNTGSAAYLLNYSKGYSLKEGWNEVVVNFDTDLAPHGASIGQLKDGIVRFGAQAVNDNFLAAGNPNGYALKDNGTVLYCDAFVATKVETVVIPAEPTNTAISIDSFGATVPGAKNMTVNTDTQYIKDGSSSLKVELVNSGSAWSVASFSNWGKGKMFTEDVNVLTFQVYATADVRVCFFFGTGGNTGSAAYSGPGYSKGIALKEGWNEVVINFDTDLTAGSVSAAVIKEGIVHFGAQAVNDAFVEPANPNGSAVNNVGTILYCDAFVATKVETVVIPAEPTNTAISIDSFGTTVPGAKNMTVNTDTQYIKDGSSSLKLELVNSGGWSIASFSNWGKGKMFTEDVNVLTFQVYATADVRVCFFFGTGGNTGSTAYSGPGYSKGIALKEGWNEVVINFDTDLTAGSVSAAVIKEGIVHFGAQAVNDTFVGPANPNSYAVDNVGTILYCDAFVATKV